MYHLGALTWITTHIHTRLRSNAHLKSKRGSSTGPSLSNLEPETLNPKPETLNLNSFCLPRPIVQVGEEERKGFGVHDLVPN